jgi:hypothetical protein
MAAAAVLTLNVPAAGAAEVSSVAGAGPWCTGTSTVCHSWDSFHAHRLHELRTFNEREELRKQSNQYRHRSPWRTYTYRPLDNMFSWNGWHSWRSWEFWN